MLAARATYTTGQGARLAASRAALDAARALADPDVLRFALTAHGRNLLDASALADGTEYLVEALALHRASDDRRTTALVLGYLGDAARWNADARGARERYDEAIVLARAARAERAEAIALGSLAELESDEGRVEAAAAATTTALDLFAAIRDVRNTASSHCNLAGYAIARDAFAEARLHARLALAILREQEDEFLLTIAVEHLAVVLGLEGDIWRAARLLGFSDASYERLAFTREFTERRGYDRLRSHLDSRLGAADLGALVAAGAALLPDDALAEALR
jgi:tetratricopeptide (TPR) repeat protein